MKKNIYIAFFIALCIQSVYASDSKASYYRGLPQDLKKLVEKGQEAHEYQNRRNIIRNIQYGFAATSLFFVGCSTLKKDVNDVEGPLLALSLLGTALSVSATQVFPWEDAIDERLAGEVIAGKRAQERLNSSNHRN